MNRKRILLTGSAGFIYSNFVRKVIFQKEPYELYSVDKIANSSMLNNIFQNKLHEFFLADICDEHVMDKIFEYIRPEIVIHGAAETAVDKSINDPTIFAKSNVVGTQVLLNLAVKHKVEKFIFQSTDEVFGALSSIDDLSWTEESPINPRNPYSASKAACELLVKAAHNTYDLPFIIVRSCNNYGMRQTPDKLIPRVIKCIINKDKIPVYGEGLQIRDWMYTDDNGSAILKLLEKGELNEVYNISANEEYTNIDIIKNICDIMGEGHKLISYVKDRPGHDFRYSVNSEKIRKLGWKPVYKFKDGLAKTIEWYIANSFYLKQF